MYVRADDTQSAKRRRLNIVNDNQSQPAPPQPYLSPHGFHTPIAWPERSNDVGTKPTDGEELVASPSTSAGHDRLSQAEKEPPECCYGMLCDIPVITGSQLNPNSNHIPVDFQIPKYLSSKLDSGLNTFHIGCPKAVRILCELENVAEVTTQLYCHSKFDGSSGRDVYHNGRRRGKPLQSWFLNIILFGRVDLEEKLGEYLSNHKMYLQDPRGCKHCVPYRNPHIIQPEPDEIVMTSSFDSTLGNLEIERLEAGPNLLAQLMENDIPLPETEPPDIVTTKLFRHQKQALTFMLRRENGWALEDGARDIWSRQLSKGINNYINNVSGYSTCEAPLDFRGGLLADDMGLGKTLSMISLIAANQVKLPSALNSMPSTVVKTTLLIVPPALMQTWVKQLSLHLRPGSIKSHVYHGHNKMDIESLEKYDVVITTYHTVSAIWRKVNDQRSNDKSIFSLTWQRIILDEAHTIQNPQSQLAQACCTLRSKRRWAITGTPIQNKLADFASIVKFLQVHPYSDAKTFEEEILKPWQNRQSTDAQGFLRLKTLVRAITITRTKAVVQLPSRIDEIHHLNFSPAEQEKYDAATIQSRVLLEEAISSGNQGSKTFNALWLLNILRLICNHGLLAQSTVESKIPQTPRSLGGWSPGGASDSFYGNILGGSANCLNCGANLLDDLLEGSAKADFEPQRQTGPCDQVICERCRSQTEDDRTGYSPWDSSVESSENSAPGTPSADLDLGFTIKNMSTKIKALIADLDKHNKTEKWYHRLTNCSDLWKWLILDSVVFSYWTVTLDLVQVMLDDKGIRHSRIDGKMSLSKRNEALRAFQSNDSTVRVILVSITCGGAGLDLTAGWRAYLIEPHWNPMIEEQALCRVHRVGQLREVTTIRYLVRDSFEEQIVNIQKRKKMLAHVTFAEGPLSEAGISLGTLQYLKSVL